MNVKGMWSVIKRNNMYELGRCFFTGRIGDLNTDIQKLSLVIILSLSDDTF